MAEMLLKTEKAWSLFSWLPSKRLYPGFPRSYCWCLPFFLNNFTIFKRETTVFFDINCFALDVQSKKWCSVPLNGLYIFNENTLVYRHKAYMYMLIQVDLGFQVDFKSIILVALKKDVAS